MYTDITFSNAPLGITANKLNKLRDDLSAAIAASGGGSGTGAMTFGETPGGIINGSNKNFVSANAYHVGRLAVFLNGLRQRPAQDYTETGTTTFRFLSAPLSGDTISIDYQS